MLFVLMVLLESSVAHMRAVGFAELAETSGLVAQNESSCLSDNNSNSPPLYFEGSLKRRSLA